ncbi:MAG: hypothetical protein ACTSW1_08825 [Candidatus Hodarchaeales archaeon]
MNNPLNFIKNWGSTEYLIGGLVFVFLISIGGTYFQSLYKPEVPIVQGDINPDPQSQAPTFQVPEIGSSLLAIVPMISALYLLKSRKG